MSFSKCSNLEAKKLIDFELCHKKIKGRTIISDNQNLKSKAFQMGFRDLKIKIKEKFKLKTKLTKKNLKVSYVKLMQNYFNSQKPFKFLKFIHWFWRYNVWGKRPFCTLLKSQKKTSNGGA